MASKKAPLTKTSIQSVWSNEQWAVQFGELKRDRRRPPKVERLFKVVGEKIPLEALTDLENLLKTRRIPAKGVYLLHDSIGATRYVGRGSIFHRLRSHQSKHPHELVYFSFFVVEDKQHEREIETLLIRGAGPLLEFNAKKKRTGIESGNVRDYEPGTYYFERQNKRGPKAKGV